MKLKIFYLKLERNYLRLRKVQVLVFNCKRSLRRKNHAILYYKIKMLFEYG